MCNAAESHPDRCNLLVATDVAQEGLDMPKCNFVIRYNFVSNEIGSVQSRGRARAPNSECYLIVERGSINEKREYENLEKEHLMMQALEDIDKISVQQLKKKIDEEQVSRDYILLYLLMTALLMVVTVLKLKIITDIYQLEHIVQPAGNA